LLLSLQSIQAYCSTDDDFNWNFALARAAAGQYVDAEESLLAITNEHYRCVCVGG
jgi:hypothetical protein